MNELIALEKIAQWQKLKALVLDSVSSPITKRVYNMALEEFCAWFQETPRPGFTKATVSAWRVSLEVRGLGSSSIIIRMSAIRTLAAEAADNGLLAPELAAGISRLMFAKIRERLGGRTRVAASGSAPLSKDLGEFYAAIGLPLIEGYGLTEGGVATLNPVDRPRPGSIGKLLPGVEARIEEDGELMLRSPCLFSGYYKDPEATARVLQDG